MVHDLGPLSCPIRRWEVSHEAGGQSLQDDRKNTTQTEVPGGSGS